MTFEYGGLEPGLNCPGAILAMKVGRSVIDEDDFLPEWRARDAARNLEFEVQLDNLHSFRFDHAPGTSTL